MPRTTNEKLDQLDLALIRELEVDARQTYPEMASKLQTSPTTIRRRLQKLLNQDIIMFATVADPVSLGYRVRTTIGINAAPGAVKAVAGQLAALPNIRFLFITTGRYDLIAETIFRNFDEYMDFVSRELGGISNLTSQETMMVTAMPKSSWHYLQDSEGSSPKASPMCDLDIQELAIIRELEQNPLLTITDLADKLGISFTGTRRKLQTLFDEGVIRVVSIPDRTALGYKIRVIIFVKTHPGSIHTVAQETARYRSVQHIQIMAMGRFDLVLWAIFRDSEEMYSFIGDELGSTPGIIRHETMVIIKMAKRSFSLLSNESTEKTQVTL